MEETTLSLADNISNGTTTFLDVCSDVLNYITGNELLVLLLVGGTIVPLGIWIFRKVKKSARG